MITVSLKKQFSVVEDVSLICFVESTLKKILKNDCANINSLRLLTQTATKMMI